MSGLKVLCEKNLFKKNVTIFLYNMYNNDTIIHNQMDRFEHLIEQNDLRTTKYEDSYFTKQLVWDKPFVDYNDSNVHYDNIILG